MALPPGVGMPMRGAGRGDTEEGGQGSAAWTKTGVRGGCGDKDTSELRAGVQQVKAGGFHRKSKGPAAGCAWCGQRSHCPQGQLGLFPRGWQGATEGSELARAMFPLMPNRTLWLHMECGPEHAGRSKGPQQGSRREGWSWTGAENRGGGRLETGSAGVYREGEGGAGETGVWPPLHPLCRGWREKGADAYALGPSPALQVRGGQAWSLDSNCPKAGQLTTSKPCSAWPPHQGYRIHSPRSPGAPPPGCPRASSHVCGPALPPARHGPHCAERATLPDCAHSTSPTEALLPPQPCPQRVSRPRPPRAASSATLASLSHTPRPRAFAPAVPAGEHPVILITRSHVLTRV